MKRCTSLFLLIPCAVFFLSFSVTAQTPFIRCNPIQGGDSSLNEATLWNHPAFWDSLYKSSDLPEKQMALSAYALNSCKKGSLHIAYELTLDLNGDGHPETLIHSDSANLPNTLYMGNKGKVRYTDGNAASFDQRTSLNASQQYRFALESRKGSGDTLWAFVRFQTAAAPTQYLYPHLPNGTHQLRWMVRDSCGNANSCVQTFTIADKKPPVAVCKPLSVNLLSTKQVTLYASDFLEFVTDNISAPQLIEYAISRGDPAPARFPTDSAGKPVRLLTFDCSMLGPHVIQLWSRDLAENASFCQVILLVQDNLYNCQPRPGYKICIKTEGGKPIRQASLQLSSPTSPIYLPMLTWPTNTECYILSGAFPVKPDTRYVPMLDENVLNGVTTLDLALISKHILGLNKFTSVYKIIAADANKSGTITTLDILALRRVILGIDPELPNNTSWRFVLQPYQPANPANPFTQPIPESAGLPDADLTGYIGFVGVKTGDVNETAQVNLHDTGSGDRSAAILPFVLRDRFVQTGEVFEVPIVSQTPLVARQFALEHSGLTLLEIVPGTADMSQEHFGRFPQRELLTHAWNSTGDASAATRFTLRFRAETAGHLSEKLRFSDQITPALAYESSNPDRVLQPELQFMQGEESSPLWHSTQPNPWSHATEVFFTLAAPGEVCLRVFDGSGRILLEKSGLFDAGMQNFTLTGNGHLGRDAPTPSGASRDSCPQNAIPS
jgi:hypothetical protein